MTARHYKDTNLLQTDDKTPACNNVFATMAGEVGKINSSASNKFLW